MALYKAEGIVLRTRNLGEADRVITLYTREVGKVEGVARGSRRTRSRLIGGTQLFTHGQYMLYSGRSLDTVSQADIKRSFSGLREDLIKMAYASYLAELLDVTVEPGEPSEDLFYLLMNAFSLLEGDTSCAMVARWFEFQLMAILGYTPQLDQCVSCLKDVGKDVRFSVREGGLLCSDCISSDPGAMRLRPSTLQVLRRLLQSESSRVGIVRPSEEDLRMLEAAGRAYVDYRLPRPLKSLDFLLSVKDLA